MLKELKDNQIPSVTRSAQNSIDAPNAMRYDIHKSAKLFFSLNIKGTKWDRLLLNRQNNFKMNTGSLYFSSKLITS